MVSHLCFLVLTAALMIGVLLGLLWSNRRGRGAHAFYDVNFSAAAVIERVQAEQGRDEPSQGARGEREPVQVDGPDHRLTEHGLDIPDRFPYYLSPLNAIPPETAVELTQPLSGPVPQFPDIRQPKRPPPEPPAGRHVLRPSQPTSTPPNRGKHLAYPTD